MSETADFIIVGAGSAGSVLADRLSADGKTRVLVIEFGGSDNSIFIKMPSALSIPLNQRRFNWGYASEPEPNLDNRRINTPRGKVVGGSSSINGLVYVRGNPRDFDRWQQEGAAGWSYGDVLPYFRRSETRAEGGDVYRGDDGPLHTQSGKRTNPLYGAFLKAAQEAGYPITTDVNGYSQEGFGALDQTIWRGRRWSAADAYLKPAARRPNVRVITHTLVTRILFEGRRAVGVVCRRGNAEEIIRANREVIVSAGAINSPMLLKLSGIGPGRELTQHGIPVIADRAGVGENLQDHLEFYFQVASKLPVSLFSSVSLFGRARVGLRWLAFHDGIGASNHFEAGGFIRSRAGVEYPDIQYHFLPLASSYDGKKLATEHGFQAHVGPMRSRSRGYVRLRSRDPTDKPAIRFNYMDHPDDWTEMRACVRLTREIFAQTAFDPYRGREIQPGADVTSDADIDSFVRARAESAYHPSCTCRMGRTDDAYAVVDPATRVIGVEGLRVVDASIMPSITTGNLNAPTIMIGEKAADLILGRPPPARIEAPVHVTPNWRTTQR